MRVFWTNKKEQINSLLEQLSIDYEDTVDNFVKPIKEFNVIELFAGAGGLAIGLEKSGIKCVALNEIDKCLFSNITGLRSVRKKVKCYCLKEYRFLCLT